MVRYGCVQGLESGDRVHLYQKEAFTRIKSATQKICESFWDGVGYGMAEGLACTGTCGWGDCWCLGFGGFGSPQRLCQGGVCLNSWLLLFLLSLGKVAVCKDSQRPGVRSQPGSRQQAVVCSSNMLICISCHCMACSLLSCLLACVFLLVLQIYPACALVRMGVGTPWHVGTHPACCCLQVRLQCPLPVVW